MSVPQGLRRRAPIVLTAVLSLSIAIPATVVAVTAFSDVKTSSPYYADVQAAVGANVMTRCAAGKFCPKTAVTREQLARVVNRLGALGPGKTPVVHAKTALTANTATNAGHAATADSATTAAALDGIPSTGFVQPTGQILISASNGAWKRFSDADNTTETDFSSTTQWSAPTVGSRFLSVSPDLPVSIFGKAVEFQGVQLCYGNSPGTSLGYVEINTVDSAAGESHRLLRMSDPTVRTDFACRIYTLPTPVLLGPNDGANLFIQVNWNVAGTAFSINRTTFILAATNTPAAAPAGLSVAGKPLAPGTTSRTDVPHR